MFQSDDLIIVLFICVIYCMPSWTHLGNNKYNSILFKFRDFCNHSKMSHFIVLNFNTEHF